MPDRQTPNRKLSWGAISRNVVFWVLIILVPIAFYNMVGAGREQYIDITYSTFTTELERGNIERAEITSGKFVQGSFKAPVPVESRKVEHFRVILPVQDSEQLIARMEQ